MKEMTKKIYDDLFVRYEKLSVIKNEILKAYEIMLETYKNGGTVYIGGNGGSASDSEHIVGELLKKFKKHREISEETKAELNKFGADGEYVSSMLEGSLPAVSLISQTSIITAYANDRAWDMALAQQLYGLSKKGDTLITLSTSGNSKNCVYADIVAKSKGLKTVSFTGMDGGKLKELSDVTICVPETETYKIQELHLPIYHCLCAMLEEELF